MFRADILHNISKDSDANYDNCALIHKRLNLNAVLLSVYKIVAVSV